MKNVKKVIIPVALALTMSLSAFLVACGEEKKPPVTPTTDKWRDESIWMKAEDLVPTDAAILPEGVNYRVPSGSVHDPSVFHDPVSDYYYAYGTHFAVAKVYYLADAFRNEKEGGWEQLAGDNDYKFLFGDEEFTYGTTTWPAAMQETVELVQPQSDVKTTWAPDVEYINGKYYMYYSLTKYFGAWESAIARVESDSPEGPFTNNKIIVHSMGGKKNVDPNCIDPELFYDKEGKLWMVYGSASGGIFIKELYNDGDKVGLPKEEGFGTKLWKGNANQEGPFVYYNAATDYYYLMCSYNSLMTNYNMHVARSKTPNGPYVGIDNKDVANDGDGNLVAGNFKMNREGGSVNGFAAMGHNSVVKDKDGKYYAIYHARRITASSGATQGTVSQPHVLYVSQIYFNEEGWPVLAPTPYVGETRGTFTNEQVAGGYDIVVHAMASIINSGSNIATLVNSTAYTLAADGTVTGGADGDSWTLKSGYYLELTLNGVTYKGVVAPGWDIYTNNTDSQKGVVTFSAISANGISIWGVQK